MGEGILNLSDKFSGVRSLDRWRCEKYEHAGVVDFESVAVLKNGLHTIYESGLPIDLYVDINPGKPLVIFFNGAAPRSDALKLPIFAGFGVLPASKNVSRLCINDPSLYLDSDLPLAWYAGSRDLVLQDIIPRIIDYVVFKAEVGSVAFVGGSGGGFAALYYSRERPLSLALVWNPQTDILKYAPHHVANYAKTAFGLDCMDEARIKIPEIINSDLCGLYEKGGSSNLIIYMQNDSDWHLKAHCEPFLNALGHNIESPPASGRLSDALYFHVGSWGVGHQQVPGPVLKFILSHLVDHPGGWAGLFSGDGLQDIINKAELEVLNSTD